MNAEVAPKAPSLAKDNSQADRLAINNFLGTYVGTEAFPFFVRFGIKAKMERMTEALHYVRMVCFFA